MRKAGGVWRAAEGVLWDGGPERAGGKLETEQFINCLLERGKACVKEDVGVEEGATGEWITLCPYFQTNLVFLAEQAPMLPFLAFSLPFQRSFQKNKNRSVLNCVACRVSQSNRCICLSSFPRYIVARPSVQSF